MPNTYIWSDTHLGHTNIIRYCNRPFMDTELMDKTILRNWRETVKGEDTIIHLGDVCFKWSRERLQNVLANLPGHKILVMGNHDRSHSIEWWREVGFHEVYPHPIIYRKWYILSHEEVFLNDKMPYINIHGHHHQHKFADACYRNVSVEQTNYLPVLFDSLLLEEEPKYEPKDLRQNTKEGE